MIAGIFLRNYKTYEKFNFIPFTDGSNENLNIFIGNNGAGKSSVLEALDTYFNDRTFVVNSKSRSRDASVSPVFLINKEKLNEGLDSEQIDFIEKLSDFLWIEDLNSLIGSNPSIENFNKFRDALKQNSNQETTYLLLFGQELIGKDTSLISMEPKAQSLFESKHGISNSDFRKKLNMTNSQVKSLYRFIYIPVETSITEFLKLEAAGMQSLINKNLKDEIESFLSESNFEVEGKGKVRSTKRRISINKFINEKLEEYLKNIETSIQFIDGTYEFNKERRTKQVNPKDFSEVIIDSYFSKRRLQKDGKEIKNLSAGERKKALIDIAYSFISQNEETEKEVVIAIDEPEASLHISMCYDQFFRIDQMANVYEKQVFVTTHWYGSLPVLSNGKLYHVTKDDSNIPELELFCLENYFESRKNHPDDINLKSFYDLTSSIISAVRNNGDKWLIVEGLADKKYIEHYLPADHGYRLLPVGGCSIVKKIFEYLYLPLSQDEESGNENGKIYCLVDTDAKAVSLDIPSTTKNKILMMRRLQFAEDEIKLLKLESGLMNVNTETELEECLNPLKFFSAFNSTIDSYGEESLLSDGTDNVKNIFSYYEFDDQAKFSFLKGEETIIKCKVGGRSFGKDIKEFHAFFDQRKEEICDAYISQEVGERPKWIEDIISFFES